MRFPRFLVVFALSLAPASLGCGPELALPASAPVPIPKERNAATIAWYREGAGGIDNEEAKISGHTALMYAAEGASGEVVKLLLARGANAAARDGYGLTACSYLAKNTVMQADEKAAVGPLLCR